MNILITHVYSKENKGDAALLSVLLKDVKRAFHNPTLTILTIDPIKEGETFEGERLDYAFMYYARDTYRNQIIQTLYAFFVGFGVLLWAYVYRFTTLSLPLPKALRQVVAHYQKADLIIPVGGGYIRSKKGFMNTVRLFFIIQPLIFSAIIGKKTIGYTQSVGPFGTSFQAWLARYAITTMNGIIVREHISLELLRSWKIRTPIHSSVDSGFSLVSLEKRDLRTELKILPEKMLVGLTVRSWLNTQGQAEYEKKVAAFCDWLVETHKAYIVFIPQVTAEHHGDDDRENSKNVFSHMKYKDHAHVMTEQYDHYEIKAMYGSLDYLVGTRFHSVIFALTSYVPSIAIEYEYKTRGIMRDLGLEQWVLDIKAVTTEHLIALFTKLVENREQYQLYLQKMLPEYIRQSESSIEFVKHIYTL